MPSVKNFSINKKNNGLLRIIIGLAVFLFLIFILNVLSSPIKNTFLGFSMPIQKLFWSAGESSSSFLGSFLNANAFFRENQNLKTENQKLLAQISFLQSITQGNDAEAGAILACGDSGFKLVMAGMVGLDDGDMLSIDKGSSDGIAEGMPVINQQKVLFGKVFKVYKDFSEVMLLSNENNIVNVKVKKNDGGVIADETESSEIDGVVKGKGGLSAYLDLIPINTEINPFDVLVTSALDKSFPKDLLVGEIIQPEKNDQKPFQQARIELYSDLKSTDNLFVITNYKQPK